MVRRNFRIGTLFCGVYIRQGEPKQPNKAYLGTIRDYHQSLLVLIGLGRLPLPGL